MKRWGGLAIFVLVLVLAAVVMVKFYSYIFSKTIAGEITRVERVAPAESVIMSGAQNPAAQLFSFAVGIKDKKGEIHTASTEDRQWAVVQTGQCADAKFYPYPPWNLDKAGTYFGARLLRLYECPKDEAKK